MQQQIILHPGCATLLNLPQRCTICTVPCGHSAEAEGISLQGSHNSNFLIRAADTSLIICNRAMVPGTGTVKKALHAAELTIVRCTSLPQESQIDEDRHLLLRSTKLLATEAVEAADSRDLTSD